MVDLVLATGNPHKVDELRAIIEGEKVSGVRVLGLADLAVKLAEPAETGTTFEDNATIKALSYARQTGKLCLADDSGLEVDSLAGRPGVISSHYATDGRETGIPRHERDQQNNDRVLRELSGLAGGRRTARFRCVMALALPGQLLTVRQGVFEGRIGEPPGVPRGDNGFGYDPLFLVPPDFSRTAAQLTPEQKNQVSHRAQAARKMVKWLGTAIRSGQIRAE